MTTSRLVAQHQYDVWQAHPDWYDFVHSIYFESPGEFEMMDGGGQCMHMICGGTWQATVTQQTPTREEGRLDLVYAKHPEFPDSFPPLEPWVCRRPGITYVIEQGFFVLDGDYTPTHRQVFRSRLRFKESPFPGVVARLGLFGLLEPQRAHGGWLTFYGHQDDTLSARCQEASQPLEDAYHRRRQIRRPDHVLDRRHPRTWSTVPHLHQHSHLRQSSHKVDVWALS